MNIHFIEHRFHICVECSVIEFTQSICHPLTFVEGSMQTRQLPRHNAVLSVKISPWWSVVILQVRCRIKSLVAGCHGRYSVLFLFFHPPVFSVTLPDTSVEWFRCTASPSTTLYTCTCGCVCVIMCVSVLWATLEFHGQEIAILFFFGPLLLPDSICSVHAPRLEALIPSDQGASTNTALTNGLLTWLSGLPPTSQRPSISPKSFYSAFNTQTKGQVCLRQPRPEV